MLGKYASGISIYRFSYKWDPTKEYVGLMAIYKVPQNVEVEDKLVGPFSFKQFIYPVIASAGV